MRIYLFITAIFISIINTANGINIGKSDISGANDIITSDNCIIAVSNFTEYTDANQLVGIFCKSDMNLYLHFKGNLLNQNYTGMKKVNLSSYNMPNRYFCNGRYIMMGGISSNVYHNVRAIISNGTIQLIGNNLIGYTYKDLASANEITVNTVTTMNGNYWMMYQLNGSNNYVYTLSKDLPYSLAIRDNGNQTLTLYYTSADNYVTTPTTFTLTKFITDFYWNITQSSTVSVSVSTNCGSQISVNQDLIVLSCPSYYSSFSMITILRESTFESIYVLNSTSLNLNIGNVVYFSGVFSTYYRIVFPSTQTLDTCPTSNCSVIMNEIELFYNSIDATHINIYQNLNLSYFSNYPYFGEYFTFDNANEMYLTGSVNSTGGNDVIFSKWCMPNMLYNSSTDNCTLISSSMTKSLSSVTLDVQSSLTSCSSIDDTITRNRLLGESFCNFSCSAKQFGKNCESCSVYMKRVGATLQSGYNWDDTNDYICESRIYNSSNICPTIASCTNCMMTSSCNYENYQCVSSSNNEISVSNQNWVMVYSYCSTYSDATEISTYCGNTTYDLDNLKNITSIKLQVSTPQNTICKFKLSSSSRSVIANDTFTISYNSSTEDIYFEIVTANGSTKSITGVASRNLENFKDNRSLSVTSLSYTFTNASSINLYYLFKTTHIPSWSVSSSLDFTSSSTSSPSSSSKSGTSVPLNPSDGSLNNNIANTETPPSFNPTVLIVVSVTGLTIIFLIGIFLYIKRDALRKRN